MDPAHEVIDPVHSFFFRKLNQKNLKIAEALDFHRKASHLYFIYILVPTILQKNNPELIQNYILVPVILYLGPCLTFYNYN
jgi:hypothetical protein